MTNTILLVSEQEWESYFALLEKVPTNIQLNEQDFVKLQEALKGGEQDEALF